jgi:hypothetical protein
MASLSNQKGWNSLLKAADTAITTLLRRANSDGNRANGTVERFNRSMKEALQAATLEGKSLRDA